MNLSVFGVLLRVIVSTAKKLWEEKNELSEYVT